MKVNLFILSVLAIGLHLPIIECQSSDNLIIRDLQILLSQTQKSVRAYLSTILVDAIILNVDAIFASASLNLTTVVNRNYACSRLTTTTTSTSNWLLHLIPFTINLIFNIKLAITSTTNKPKTSSFTSFI